MAPISLLQSLPLLALCGGISLAGLVLAWLSRRVPRAVASPSLTRERVVGGYRLGEKIGEGGMGIVYRAEDLERGRPCAVKVLASARTQPLDKQRFQREACVTRRLVHENVVRVYDYGTSADGAPYYAMEYVDGQDLQTLVDSEGPLPAARVAHVLAQLASALAEAHDAGLVHRDIKPANVMVSERGARADHVKLIDFGLVKTLAADPELGAPRELGEHEQRYVVGTPLYLAPEAIANPETQDERSDIYALGAVGYFLLTGVAPFSGKTLIEVCCHHLHTPVVPPTLRGATCVPAELERLLLSCLEKAPEQRPHSAKALATALAALSQGPTSRRSERVGKAAPSSGVYLRNEFALGSGTVTRAGSMRADIEARA